MMSELVVWMERWKIRNLCKEEEKCEERNCFPIMSHDESSEKV